MAPERLKNTKPSSTPAQLDPESLDPRTLRLLWMQREQEIQALRYAIQNHQGARQSHILHEVAGLPLERSSGSQEKLLQTQVQKLTLELKEQKEQAQLEKAHLEEQLLQTRTLLQQKEAEIQALQKSCLMKLARSSWAGRMLRSSTGSVEVVTAETLMEPSDSSEDDEPPPAGEGFRLEDVDWNVVARRYPNLLASIKTNSDYKRSWQRQPAQLPPASQPEEGGSALPRKSRELQRKSVEWKSLPLAGTGSSEDADSNSSCHLLDKRLGVQNVTGCPPSHISFQEIEWQTRSFSGDPQAEPEGQDKPAGPTGGSTSQPDHRSLDLPETHTDRLDKTAAPVAESCADSDHWQRAHPWSRRASCLKIVAVSLRKRFVRILNESTERTADLGGFIVQQLRRDFPVFMYRFPPHTLLPPRHHITVWGTGPSSSNQPPPSAVGREPVHFHSSLGFVTLLLSPNGEVFSEHHVPRRATPVSRDFEDDTNLSTDCFPPSEAQSGAYTRQKRRPPGLLLKGRVREARSRSWKPGTGTLFPRPTATSRKFFGTREMPVPRKSTEIDTGEFLPAISLSHAEDRLCLADRPVAKEHRVQVCRKGVDRRCPMVALSVRGMAERRFGFRAFGYLPVAADACRPV